MTDSTYTVANPNRTRNLSLEDVVDELQAAAGTDSDGEQAA